VQASTSTSSKGSVFDDLGGEIGTGRWKETELFESHDGSKRDEDDEDEEDDMDKVQMETDEERMGQGSGSTIRKGKRREESGVVADEGNGDSEVLSQCVFFSLLPSPPGCFGAK
jgi:hypothetical protein